MDNQSIFSLSQHLSNQLRWNNLG